ncbi:acetyl-CoA carboxylase biotin carboxyl carrier protein [Paraburkholderia sp. DGU8]|jgi:acetyl-CoA carboxylase biotin carboxyl carrier protein|uniref:acetyl-CoA carboxylase biotin carboxyl carrier protein n=1 Tax=Paraburkholderia sp. DGU8 TaxID=3161997 RepID=UPI0034675A23
MDIDFAELAALVTLLKEADFTQFRYEKGDVRIDVRRGGVGPDASAQPMSSTLSNAPVPPAAATATLPTVAAAPATTRSEESIAQTPVAGAVAIKAPMLGTFYTTPKPGERAFVSVGDRVEPDTVLCIVEVMKLMNSVHAGVHGVVVGVHANDGELVEFGQLLFSIREEAAR